MSITWSSPSLLTSMLLVTTFTAMIQDDGKDGAIF
jgi:hypothetical protein